MIILNPEQLKECTNSTLANAEKYCATINATMEAYEINTFLRQAHFLSQLGHESGSLFYTVEIASGKKYEGRVDLGNTQKGDGVRYKGRGLIQITGRTNYSAYGKSVGIDFVQQPKLLESLPYCVDSAGWFWTQKNLNRYAEGDSLSRVTRRINGGFTGLDDRKKRLAVCKKVLAEIENS